MTDAETSVRELLFGLKDEKYREFQCGLIPTVPPERVIGVRTPELRKLAAELAGSAVAADYIAALPHDYYDENNLHGFLIEKIKDFDEAVAAVNAFLPYVDNWATCDLMTPKAFRKGLPALIRHIQRWIASDEVYTIRFGVEMLMSFYLDDAFSTEYPDMVASIRSEEYYVNMMTAWYFATALAKQYDSVLPYIEGRRLDRWTHNKAIQKAIESRRITAAQKDYLRGLKIP